jgi:hypothetical protein
MVDRIYIISSVINEEKFIFLYAATFPFGCKNVIWNESFVS